MITAETHRPRILDTDGQEFGPRCECCGTMPQYSIRGFGNLNARVMAIGIAPGRHEMKWGAPLVGPSGVRHDLCLRAVKYPREKTYSTNLVCFWKDEPSTEEIAACWPRLRAEIEQVRPRLILALGALACEWLTGYSVGKVRGDLIRPEYNRSEHFADLAAYYTAREGPVLAGLREPGGYGLGDDPGSTEWQDCGDLHRLPTILPTWHPAATLRIASLATDVIRDYRKIRPFLKGRYEPLQWDWRLVENREEAQKVLDSFTGQEVSLDVETERDEADSFQKITCVAMATEDPRGIRAPNGDPAYFAYVFPVEVLRGLRWPRNVRWLQHNMQFDTPAIKREYGIWLTGVRDTMIWSQCIDERPGRGDDSTSERERSGEGSKPKGPGLHSLKQLAAEFLGCPPGYGDEMKKSFGKTLEEIAAPQHILLTEEEIGAQAEPLAVVLLAGDGGEPVGRDDDHPAADGTDGGSSPEAPHKPAAKRKGKGAKAKAPTRMETSEEARARFEAFLQKLYAYNALDAVNTIALPSRFPRKPCPAFETLIMPAARAYARIHLTGVPVDLDRVQELQEEWTPWIKELQEELQQEAHELGFRNTPKLKRDLASQAAYEEEHGVGTWPLGIATEIRKAMRVDERLRVSEEWLLDYGPNSWPGYEPLNLGSSQQLGKFLFGKLRIPIKVRSKKTGKPSVGKEAIADIEHPFVDRMEEVRTAKHVKASHLDPIPELVKGDGRLHPNIWTIGAVNYRRSITNPPLQQYPQEHPQEFWKRLAEVKSIIRPEPGFCLIEADFSQVELWGAALLSQDPVFLADLATGDIHTTNVRNVFKCMEPKESVVFSHTRRIAKVFVFATIYRAEENTLAKIMSEGAGFGSKQAVTPREAGRLSRQWYARNRVFWNWQEDIIQQVKRYGKLTNPFGEVRHFPLWDSILEKQIVNWPISSTCGAHTEEAVVELEPIIRRDFGGSILFDTHDSLLFHIPTKKKRSAARVIKEIMETPRVPGWPPLKVEFKLSTTNWRELHPWEVE